MENFKEYKIYENGEIKSIKLLDEDREITISECGFDAEFKGMLYWDDFSDTLNKKLYIPCNVEIKEGDKERFAYIAKPIIFLRSRKGLHIICEDPENIEVFHIPVKALRRLKVNLE